MNNPRLAGRYAKSLLDLAVEQNQLADVFNDVKFLMAVCKNNPDFVSLLKSPIVNTDKKEKIIVAITNGRVTPLTGLFLALLLRKTREKNLPEILNAFIEQYNILNKIQPVKITTAKPMTADVEEILLNRIKAGAPGKTIELETAVEENLIGGFKLQMGDLLVDASILYDLNDVKKQFKSNEYIHQIR